MIELPEAILGRQIVATCRKTVKYENPNGSILNKKYKFDFKNKTRMGKGKLSEAYIDKIISKETSSFQISLEQIIRVIKSKLKEKFGLEYAVCTEINIIKSEVLTGECSDFKTNDISGFSGTHGGQRTVMSCKHEVLCYAEPKFGIETKFEKV